MTQAVSDAIVDVAMNGTNGFRLFLRLGDKVNHRDYGQWGLGEVVEEMTSTVSGGTCLVRIVFQDGKQRVFHNDLDAPMCCYYMGLRKVWESDDDDPPRPPVVPRRIGRD